ncbi:hypothetical protein CAC42_3922 [Sphaceloma murrayae]|uniref:Uncharacterized protein n=1 Tax=Sphaceloma murrayae TaxID=2082308 RepID=A0A2K1QSW5_9PEZI|nr:hypothetical protein CAC42_3922 [Sphaceloma murrayae]
MLQQVFLLAAFSAALSSVTAGLLPRQGCDGTAWVTETPAAVTTSTYVNLDVFYTTSTVTAYALSPPASPSAPATTALASSDAPAALRRSPQATEPCNASTTSTTTAPTPTTTITTTYTFSRAARVTTYLQACDPSTGYGQDRGTLVVNNRYQSFSPREVTSSDASVSECCESCFRGNSAGFGCLIWGFNGDICSMTVVDAVCPKGDAGTEVLWYPNEEKPFVGQGPCLKEVGYFVEG